MFPLSLSGKGQESQWGKDREDDLRSFIPCCTENSMKLTHIYSSIFVFIKRQFV